MAKQNILSVIITYLSLAFGLLDTAPSPKASTDLICHTNHASECYPSIFQPAEKFQVVHDDQALPPGLHVRMNLATGVKEARLNVPEPESGHSDLVIIDEPEEPEAPPGPPTHHGQAVFSGRAPRVRPPRFDADEAATFHRSITALKSASVNSEELVPALTDLQELVHSQDWGLALTKDSHLTRFLVQIFRDVSSKLAIRSLSALLLATAIQNNPEALSAALAHFYKDEWPTSPLDAVFLALLHESSPQFLIRTMFLLHALCQDPKQLAQFANSGGMPLLLTLLNADDAGQDDKDKLRGKIANFVVDYLDQLDHLAMKTDIGDGAHSRGEAKKPSEYQDDWELVADPEKTALNGHKDLDQDAWKPLLQEYCSAFQKCIERFSSNYKNHDGIAALDSIMDAYEKTRKRMERP
ncbi:MAG: hypothetical protein Q9191_006053 [Dirinaria sp. TL-2023a]